MRDVYIGSFTKGAGGAGTGITRARQDPKTGRLLEAEVVAELVSPSFLAWHPSGRYLYAVDETEPGSLAALRVLDDGRLALLDERPSGGAGPCHLAVHPAGMLVMTAHYGSGSVAVHPIGADGSLGPVAEVVQHTGAGVRPDRQEGPHLHQVRIAPDGRRVLGTDLGNDVVYAYDLDLDTGKVRSWAVAGRTRPGAGPRHLAFGPGGAVYATAELDSTIAVFGSDSLSMAPGLTPRGAVAATVGAPGGDNYPSEIVVDDGGRFVYVANRGSDVVSVFAVTGTGLRPVADVPAGGRWPRHLALAHPYLYVANERSHEVTCLRIDPDSGIPHPTGSALGVPSPACVSFAPTPAGTEG